MAAIIDLGLACPFAILGGTPSVTNTGPSVITGDVGVWPAAAVIGFGPPAVVTGTIHAGDAAAQAAQSDLTTAFNAGNALAPTQPPIIGGVFDGLSLVPGVYDVTGVTGSLTGVLDFNGVGDYVIRIPSSLTINVGAIMTLSGGADAKRIFWIIGSSASINTGVTFKGSILALTSITVANASNVEGKLLARNGTVTLDTNVVNSDSCFADACPTITLTPSSLPSGFLGIAYDQTIVASGGLAPYTFAVTAGALPNGLVLNPATGQITGIPILAGTFNFTIEATDDNGCIGVMGYTITISPESCPFIEITPFNLQSPKVNVPYSSQLSGSGGTSPYTFEVTGGSLPNGLSLSSDGLISGTPTVQGNFSFTVTVTDSDSCQSSRQFNLNTTGGFSNCFCDKRIYITFQ